MPRRADRGSDMSLWTIAAVPSGRFPDDPGAAAAPVPVEEGFNEPERTLSASRSACGNREVEWAMSGTPPQLFGWPRQAGG